MTDPIVRGSCLCGQVRFSARLPSKWVAHCHCTYCRRAHGAAFVTWAGFVSDRVAIDPDGAQPSWYESSPGARRGFCAHCGSPMLFTSTRWPDEMHVARALIADALDREPSAHVFFNTHVPWIEVNDSLPKKAPQAEPPPPAATGPAPAGAPSAAGE
jgi:hypothetical protein